MGNQEAGKKTKVIGPVFALTAVRALDIKGTSVGKTSLLVAAILVPVVIMIGVAYQKHNEELIRDMFSEF